MGEREREHTHVETIRRASVKISNSLFFENEKESSYFFFLFCRYFSILNFKLEHTEDWEASTVKRAKEQKRENEREKCRCLSLLLFNFLLLFFLRFYFCE